MLDDTLPSWAASSADSAGAGSSLSNQDRFGFLGTSGCLGGGALVVGMGEGRDGEPLYALSNMLWLEARFPSPSRFRMLGWNGGTTSSTCLGNVVEGP